MEIMFIEMMLIWLSVFVFYTFVFRTNKKLDLILENNKGYIFLKLDNDDMNKVLLESGIFKYRELGPNDTKLYSYLKTKLDKNLINKYIKSMNIYRHNGFTYSEVNLTSLIVYAEMLHNVIQLCYAINIPVPNDLISKKIRDFINSNVEVIVNGPQNHFEVFELLHTFESLEDYCIIAFGNFETSVVTSNCMQILDKLNKDRFKYLDLSKLNKNT